jgi:hypothetical protein
MWASWRGVEYTIRGKVMAFPQVWAVMSLVSSSLPVTRPSTKMLKLCTNQLVWFVQICVSD